MLHARMYNVVVVVGTQLADETMTMTRKKQERLYTQWCMEMRGHVCALPCIVWSRELALTYYIFRLAPRRRRRRRRLSHTQYTFYNVNCMCKWILFSHGHCINTRTLAHTYTRAHENHELPPGACRAQTENKRSKKKEKWKRKRKQWTTKWMGELKLGTLLWIWIINPRKFLDARKREHAAHRKKTQQRYLFTRRSLLHTPRMDTGVGHVHGCVQVGGRC